jgi:hypothetical protein
VDETIRGIRKKLKNGVTRDGKIGLGLCDEKNGLLTYDGLIWIPDNDELRIGILLDHHDAQAAPPSPDIRNASLNLPSLANFTPKTSRN